MKPERKDYYDVVRYKNTDVDWMINVEFIETIYAIWSEAVKEIKSKYVVRKTDRKNHRIIVA